MTSKFSKISKDLLITGLIIFAALNFRAVFSMTQTSHFVAKHIIYLLIAFVPFSVLITSKLSDGFRKEFKANDIAAIIVIMYAFTVVLHDSVIRYYILTAIGIASASLLLCKNIYALVFVAILNLITSFVPQLGSSSVVSIPATICLSMVYFSYIFEKPKAVSNKKHKKAENLVSAPDYKKEKIIFAISEIILFAALAIMIYYRQYTVALITFRSNLKYIIPILVPAVCFVIFAVLSIKNKKPFTEVIGYLVAVATMPLSQLCEYSVAAAGTLTAFMLLLTLCDPKLTSGKAVEKVYENTVAKLIPKKETVAE